MRPPARVRTRYDYTKGSIGWGLARLSLPTFGEQIAWNIDTVVEIFWVGRLGPDRLAGMALAFLIIMLMRSIGLGIRIAGSAMVAQRVGGGDNEGAAVFAGQTFILAMAYYLPVTFVGYMAAPGVMSLLTTDLEVVRLGTLYLRAGFMVFAFIDGIFTMAHVMRAAGEPVYSLSGMIVSTTISVALMPLLVFGAGPFPGLDLAGTILSVGLGRMCGVITITAILASGRSRLRLRGRHLRPRPAVLRRLLGLAWPAAATNLLERGASIVLVRMLSVFGVLALAAWGLGNRIALLGRMPGFGLQAAVRTMVGQSVGAGRPDRARRSVQLALWILILIMGVTATSLFIYANEVVGFFGLKGEAASVGALCVRILVLGLPFETWRRVLAGAFQGGADTKPPMAVEAVVRWAVQLPAAYLVSLPLGLGAAGIWGAVAGSQALGAMALFVWYFRRWGKRALAARSGLPGGGG